MDDDTTARPSDVELARRAIGLIDLTDLADDHADTGIDQLCHRAAEHGTAAVCVWPEHVARCRSLLAGTPVRVATVVNFPTGEDGVDAVVERTRAALDHGADEIDVVQPYRAVLLGDLGAASTMVRAVRAAVPAPAVLKVILETGALRDGSSISETARVAVEEGADFVKTSTGKVPIGATPEAVRLMLEVIADADRPVGVKPSGGIRSLDDVRTYLALAAEVMGPEWATPATFRFGASGLLDALLEVLRGSAGAGGTVDSAY